MRPTCPSRSVSSLRRFGLLSLLTDIAGLAALPAWAQTDAYPSKPITLVVGYPPGGSTDLTGRVLGAELAKRRGVAEAHLPGERALPAKAAKGTAALAASRSLNPARMRNWSCARTPSTSPNC